MYSEWWGAGVVICLERGADLHMAHVMPVQLIVSYVSKVQTGFTFLVPAHPGSPGQRAVKWVCVLMYSAHIEAIGDCVLCKLTFFCCLLETLTSEAVLLCSDSRE